MGGEDHRCEWRDKAEKLEAELRDVRGEMASMQGTLEKLQRHGGPPVLWQSVEPARLPDVRHAHLEAGTRTMIRARSRSQGCPAVLSAPHSEPLWAGETIGAIGEILTSVRGHGPLRTSRTPEPPLTRSYP